VRRLRFPFHSVSSPAFYIGSLGSTQERIRCGSNTGHHVQEDLQWADACRCAHRPFTCRAAVPLMLRGGHVGSPSDACK